MKFKLSVKNVVLLIAALVTTQHVNSGLKALTDVSEKSEVKELYLPSEIWKVPKNNDFKNDTSEYCFTRMKESKNLAIFWAKRFGNDPMANPDTLLRFDVDYILKEGERIYEYYVNDLKFVEKGNSITDKYKCLIFIIDDKGGTAFGGGAEDKVGIFWAPPIRMRKAPFGALAHELGHSFQYLSRIDKAKKKASSGRGGGGPSLGEMTSQYMLWNVYPNWITFENYHLVDFMKQTHLAYLHPKNMYHSPFVMEYWSNKHGIDIMSKIWSEGEGSEDPVMTYKRITSISQEEFNNEIFDAACRFITWDMKRIESFSKKYTNQHFSKLDSIGNGWYRISVEKCPQNYGYNGIKLLVPAKGKEVTLNFKGIAGAEGFSSINIDKAGWRYGFLAVKADGSRVYGKINSNSVGEVKFKVPKNTQYLWLVVSGAPTEHWPITRGNEKEEQWPYQIKLSGTSIDITAMK